MSATVKAWLLLGGIFIVGVVTGGALTFGFASHFRSAHNEAEIRTHLMTMYVRRLDLTDDQRAKIVPIVRDTAHSIQDLHHDEVSRGSEIFRTANEKILAILTPDQKAQLQKIEQEQEAMFSSRLMRPGGPPREGPGGVPGFFHQMNQTGPGNGYLSQPPPPPNGMPDSQPPSGQTNAPASTDGH
jgi:Spy/CpxP family protein refolding chaperone